MFHYSFGALLNNKFQFFGDCRNLKHKLKLNNCLIRRDRFMNIKNFAKAVAFAIISAILSTPLQILNSIYILQDSAPPEFAFLFKICIIGLMMKVLYATAYVLMGQKLPIKSQKTRAFVFILTIWCSDYMPQVLGLIGADGPIAEAAFSLPLIACDTLSYIIDGVLLGFLYKNFPYYKTEKCIKTNLIKTSVLSAIIFPVLVFAFEQVFGFLYSPLYIFNAMEASNRKIVSFTVSFYSCLIITGALLPIIYRYTEFNTRDSSSPFRFGAIYSICLWMPVVLIMVAFGTNILTTFVYIIIFIICILAVAKMNDYLLTKD